ncbi:MAG TPA: phosphomannomutase/phosphoglucomutase [Thiotrichales bacterium]|nr:MAG: phosphomannomutase/phosphoglucomutase [Thiotrichales bacterium 16-46-22]OZA17191.1 MAG: phosphomannomutase/phosphoglucomutase [Thiotrichales bacterium 17-46-47]HQT02461.1 phosphomannomutase/phosphoglucomutase [Thiotrichales bacterium]HQT04552.1 phosphomannomutase/phosphoglucomutase [Thiotrichales bacterium]
MIDPSIFRAYDIRGIVDTALTEDAAYGVGRALASEVLASGGKAMAVGRDGRLSGPRLMAALVKGVTEGGVDVVDVGMVTTPMVYFAAATLEGVTSCAAITGSHNPPNYNGIKMVVAGHTLSGDAIQGLRQRIEAQDFSQGQGSVSQVNVFAAYTQRIASDIQLKRPLKVVVDAGNGVAGAYAPAVLRAIGVEVIELFCEVDGTFPNHHPDPSKPKNLKDMIAKVKEVGADVGLAFDGDGDRVGVVDETGNLIFADRQMMLYAADVLSRNEGAQIIFDVKCSSTLARHIEAKGGQPLMWRTGHSFIKAKLKETGAPLAGEMSGHIFFKDRWFGFDDGIYAACRMLEILAQDSRPASHVFNELPDSFSTPEMDWEFAEGEHFAFMDKLKAVAEFPEGQLFDLDGIRVDFADGWGLIRASNTTPILVIRFDADSEAGLERIKATFRKQIEKVADGMQIPF